MIVLSFFLAAASAVSCATAAVNTPCACVPTANEASSPCTGTFVGVTNALFQCVIAGSPTCDTTGALNVNSRCCQNCGANGPEAGIGGATDEQCDPPTAPTGCCAANCRFQSSGANCDNPSDVEGVTPCSAQDTCDSSGGCTPNSNSGACAADSTVCTDDVCSNGDCTHPAAASPPPTCETDTNPCTDDVCSGATCQHNPPGSCGGGVGDPHIFGPFGERFMFNGQAGGIYSFFATKHFAVNVQTDHLVSNQNQLFMVNVGLVFGNVTLKLMLYERWYADKVNAALQTVGGRLDHGDHNALYMDLCPGHRVVVKKTWGVVRRDFHLDVTIDVPGCHDEYHGLVGQLYQCKYMKTKFHWDSTTEESFRVPTLSYVDAQFDPREPCFDQAEFGKLEKH